MATEPRPRIPIVVGVGNPLLGDDGLGVRATELLKGSVPDNVRIIDGGLIGLDLLHDVEEASELLIIDSIDAGAEPGSLVRITGGDMPAFGNRLSPHEMHLSDVLSLVRLRDTAPDQIVVLGIQPLRVTPGIGLSPVVEAALPRLLEEARALLERWVHEGTGAE